MRPVTVSTLAMEEWLRTVIVVDVVVIIVVVVVAIGVVVVHLIVGTNLVLGAQSPSLLNRRRTLRTGRESQSKGVG